MSWRAAVSVSITAACLCAVYVLRYYYRMPMFEQQQLAPYLAKMSAGQPVSWLQLGEVGGGHWYLLGNILLLWLAHWSHWDLRWDALCELGFLAASAWVLYFHIRRIDDSSGAFGAPFLFACVSCLLFALTQASNLLWLHQISHPIHALCVFSAAVIIGRQRPLGLAQHGILLMCSLAAVYSLASGLVLIMGINVCLWLRQERWFWKALWAFVLIACVARYLQDYWLQGLSSALDTPPAGTGLFSIAVRSFLFVCNALGSPLSRFATDLTGGWGLLGLLLAAVAVVACLRRYRGQYAWLTGALIAMTALGYMAMAALGRYRFGVDQALNPRYIAEGNLFWIGLLILLYHAKLRLPPRLWQAMTVTGIVFFAANSVAIAHKCVKVSEKYASAIADIRRTWPDTDAHILGKVSIDDDAEQARAMIAIMARLQYNVFTQK